MAVERGRVVIQEDDVIKTRDGKTATFTIWLSTSRTAATLKETCIMTSPTGLYADFPATEMPPENVKKHNDLIPTDRSHGFDELTFEIGECRI